MMMFCWQPADLGVIPGYENAVAPVKVGQRRAEEILAELMAKAEIPDGVKVSTNAFHIPASKGLIAASRYASHLVVGLRGLSGLDAHFLESVSRQIVNFAGVHGDRGALIHRKSAWEANARPVMGLQGGIYSLQPHHHLLFAEFEFILRPPCSGAAAR